MRHMLTHVVCLLMLAVVPLRAQASSADGPAFNPTDIAHRAGVYKCELNRTVNVRHVGEDLRTAVIHWNKRDYKMTAVNTHSGALRYEDVASGLVWIVITGKSMLLDTRHGRQLANECRT